MVSHDQLPKFLATLSNTAKYNNTATVYFKLFRVSL